MDENILNIKEIISPNELLDKYSINDKEKDFIQNSRQIVKHILTGQDDRLIVIIGPCSIHNYDLALEYATHIKRFQNLYPNLYIIMRVYFEKPRSRHGWKGFIYDPDLDNTFDINKGLTLARKLCVTLTHMEIPIGCEFLDTITPQYLSDLISWGAIGARTSESQIHRQLASGISAPVGFKNLTDGDYKKAIDGILSAKYPHQFLGINYNGNVCHVSTKGNEYAHLILRGGIRPNYYQNDINEIIDIIIKESISTGIIIDCSHGNSSKDYMKQILVACSINRLLSNELIRGIMIESHIKSGNQKLKNVSELKEGVSITDGCIDIDASIQVLNILNNRKNRIRLDTLGTIREYLSKFEECILDSSINNDELITTNVISPEIIINYDDELFKIVNNNSKLMCILHRRISLSELIADIKFNLSPMNFLNKKNDFYKLVTDREIEKSILGRVNNDLFIKIIELSKRVQVLYLEEYIKTKKIGFLGTSTTFSYEVLSSNFYGEHIGCINLNDMYIKLDDRKIEYGLVPTYNSLIGVLYTIDTKKYKIHGSIDHKIILSVFSNNNTIGWDTAKTLYIQEMVYKESMQYIESKMNQTMTIKICDTTEEGCIKCIEDKTSMTISSTKNKCSFLHLVDDNIIDHNITTFSLIKIDKN
jgi:3-deoxy-7-phosphoheptulonate synthase